MLSIISFTDNSLSPIVRIRTSMFGLSVRYLSCTCPVLPVQVADGRAFQHPFFLRDVIVANPPGVFEYSVKNSSVQRYDTVRAEIECPGGQDFSDVYRDFVRKKSFCALWRCSRWKRTGGCIALYSLVYCYVRHPKMSHVNYCVITLFLWGFQNNKNSDFLGALYRIVM